MKRFIIYVILIVFCFILQSNILQVVSFNGIVPNLLIVLSATVGFMRGRREGLLVGFFCGFLVDVFFGEVLGVYALLYMCFGYVNGFFCHIFYPEDIKLPIGLILLSDLSYGVVCYFLMFVLRARFHFGHFFAHIILPEVIYTILITLLLYPLLLKLNQQLEKTEKRSEKKFV